MTCSRRRFLATSAGLAGGLALPFTAARTTAAETKATPGASFRYCFNTSCIRKAKLPLDEIVRQVAAAGYDGFEPWINEIETFTKEGGNLADLRKLIEDSGLQVESAIGFPRWGVEDDAERQQGLEQAKREMDMVRQLGGRRIAAPPSGINGRDYPEIPLMILGARYRALLELGVSMEVIPQLEIWGSSRNLHHISQAAFVAIAANHPQAAILLDIYHLYRGGSDFDGLRMLSGVGMNIFHVNDYPAEPPREQTRDSDRVYPGDGIAPLNLVFQSLRDVGFQGALSLELFNETYYQQPTQTVIKTGLQKMKDSVATALA